MQFTQIYRMLPICSVLRLCANNELSISLFVCSWFSPRSVSLLSCLWSWEGYPLLSSPFEVDISFFHCKCFVCEVNQQVRNLELFWCILFLAFREFTCHSETSRMHHFASTSTYCHCNVRLPYNNPTALHRMAEAQLLSSQPGSTRPRRSHITGSGRGSGSYLQLFRDSEDDASHCTLLCWNSNPDHVYLPLSNTISPLLCQRLCWIYKLHLKRVLNFMQRLLIFHWENERWGGVVNAPIGCHGDRFIKFRFND